MIRVGITQDDMGYVDFKGDAFYDILSFVKSRRYHFNPEEKRWEAPPKKVWEHLTDLGDFDTVSIDPDTKEKLKDLADNHGKQETRFAQQQLVDDYFVSPPIQGKSPHEDFQTECIQKGVNQNRAGFFLGMGSGKSFCSITIFNHHFANNDCDRLLIIAPPEGIYNWRRELLKFSTFINSEDDIVISRAQHNRDPFENGGDPKVVIMTYRHFLTLSDDYYEKKTGQKKKKYRKPTIPFDTWGNNRGIILDESHNIKNIKARQTRALHLHKRFFYYRYLLTGTPSPNLFPELYSQMYFLDSGLLPDNYYEWLEEIANLGNRFSDYAINYIYKQKQKEWESKFESWVVRYTSDQILDLPDLYIKPIYAEMSDLQKSIYEEIIDFMVYKIKEENDGRLEPQLLINKFAWIALAYENASVLKGKIDPVESRHLYNLVNKFNFEKHHGKLEVADSLVNTYINDEKQKVTIFDFHPKTIDELAKRYKKYNPIVIHGQNTPKGMEQDEFRDQQLEKFKNSSEHNLLIASSKVISMAVNLVECKRVIYFSRSFSYVDYAQSIKRFHRIGQDDPVIVNNLIFQDSLDERLNRSLNEKKDLDESIFNKESLSKEEWKDIFKGKI
jgi:SNF2 family DNA or RNA helicase